MRLGNLPEQAKGLFGDYWASAVNFYQLIGACRGEFSSWNDLIASSFYLQWGSMIEYSVAVQSCL